MLLTESSSKEENNPLPDISLYGMMTLYHEETAGVAMTIFFELALSVVFCLTFIRLSWLLLIAISKFFKADSCSTRFNPLR